MSNKDKCKLIITRMIESGHTVVEPEIVDTWGEDDINYVVANYEDSYITRYKK